MRDQLRSYNHEVMSIMRICVPRLGKPASRMVHPCFLRSPFLHPESIRNSTAEGPTPGMRGAGLEGIKSWHMAELQLLLHLVVSLWGVQA